jgi:hypothetical protein
MRSGLLAATLTSIHALTSSSIHPTEFDVIWIRIGKLPYTRLERFHNNCRAMQADRSRIDL